MKMTESQDIEQATTAIAAQPDNKTRRYDRQLRLWAASGQAALESSRVLVLSASATSTSILKNLVLPGIGHFTLVDSTLVSPADAGNNFFLNGRDSIGKSRAQEAVPLLRELNESVQGEAVVSDVKELLSSDSGREWITGFSLVIAHNLAKPVVDDLAALLWDDLANPPLIVVNSAGFLAEFFISISRALWYAASPHTDAIPTLRITRPFPALLQWARDLDLENMDPTTHAHIPFVIILVRAVDLWRREHNGALPTTMAEKRAFKESVLAMKIKPDEENFDEAEQQAWRVWSEPAVPSEISALFSLPELQQPSTSSDTNALPNPTFHALLRTLSAYVRLQRVYREQAAAEKTLFKELLAQVYPELAQKIDPDEVDTFVKNSHHVRVLRGRPWRAWDKERDVVVSSLSATPRESATHLALSALSTLLAQSSDISEITVDSLKKEVQSFVGPDVELPEEVDTAIGELARAPTADLPNMAAFLGGMVAQEAIKMITQQYVPVCGYCVLDLVDSWTGIVG
ncbi:NEDD8-activating enzyme E1 regulatory subunit [Grifola frondosa]|uniref:NEDD8-activating enzyme E1 regulatory subunit n=1 Tax=Grifola frondosa TaxID=5627 RepID=A0A1C7MKD3_GRIFR|nr:NEDD8-activating enzyme E1 regulatory subunit [Grifola frondosa]